MVMIQRIVAFFPVLALTAAETIAVAKFPAGGSYAVEGSITFTPTDDGLEVDADFENLPTLGSPFQFHIHEFPVPENGNCTATGGHFNPLHANASLCNASDWSTCESGDLSGKYGKINGTHFTKHEVDPYISLNSTSDLYIGEGRSIVFHYANSTRFACANLTIVDDETASSVANATSTIDSLQTDGANALALNGLLAVGAAALLALI
ncbi:BA75_04342T0 [Komagataella pastoris]|uniref:superoxide dismutase n=1 Tax=Komagataella pastoris TaxID=4922 RepID=A0A1B2JGN4_PICPA|nr:BA75_04342T0 [Komagataella pastoris]